jgi:hypothetical protein
MSKTRMKEMGPLEIPVVDWTTSFLGPAGEGKARAAADLWIRAVCLTASKISSMNPRQAGRSSGELAQFPAGVHEGRRVGRKASMAMAR